jgi:hypothetical protein
MPGGKERLACALTGLDELLLFALSLYLLLLHRTALYASLLCLGQCPRLIRSADCTNVDIQAPPPSSQTYLTIDDAYVDWYKKRFGKQLDRSLVLPIKKTLQGHPEAGALWERYIVGILTGPELQLHSTTQERNLYAGIFNGEPILICRMVDDFSLLRPPQPSSTSSLQRAFRFAMTGL